MKLGVSYNLFDGEELLEGSIKCIRDQVDYISVVYQTMSNFGNPCNPELVPLLNKLKESGLIDELFEYKPKLSETYNTSGIKVIEGRGHFNEITKRNVGLSLSVGAKCTHHMSMDSDEYYLPEQFKFLKDEMLNGDYDSSYCQMKTYYKSWEYQLDPPEEYYVSLIYKINQYSLFEMGKYSPVLVDPTRRMESGKHRIFKREEIEMHHGSYIRNNIRTKLDNSSASTNFKNDIEKIVNHYNNWSYPNKVLWGGLPSTLHNVKQIKNLF
jgi:hypothetical protein